MMKKRNNTIRTILLGVIFILVGLGIGAQKLGYPFQFSSLFFDGWWTLFLIVPGVIGLFKKDSNKVFDAVLIAIGAALLAGQYIELNIWDWIGPAAVIAVGVWIAVAAFRGRDDAGEEQIPKEERRDVITEERPEERTEERPDAEVKSYYR